MASTTRDYQVLVDQLKSISGRDQRLVGLSGGVDSDRVALWITDFDENGLDDILVASPTSFIVLQMGEP